MKKLFFIWAIMHFFACSKSSSSSNSDPGGGTITMKTASGASYSSSNITRVLQTTTGVFFFNADPFDSYRKFYYFSGSFDVNNSLTLDLYLNALSGTSLVTRNTGCSVIINNKYYYPIKSVVNFTSNVYPGRIAGNYSFYDDNSLYDDNSPRVLLCSGTFDYNAK